jgi:PAS domain S-box-containing protein
MQQFFSKEVKLDSIPLSYFTLDKNGVIQSVNYNWCNATEYTPEDVEGVYFGDLLPDNQKNIFPKTYREFRSKLKTDFRTYKIRKKSGEYSDFIFYASAETEEGTFLKGHFIMLDQASLKTTERELTRSKYMYKLLADNIKEVVCVYNITQGSHLYVSPSVSNLRGYSVEEAMSETLVESLTLESRPVFEKAVKEAETDFLRKPDQDLPFFLEVKQRCKDGSEINVEMQARFQLAANGDLEMICVSRKLSSSKLEDTLRLMREKEVERMAELTGDMFTLSDNEGRLIKSNKRLENTLDYKFVELSSNSLSTIIHPDDELMFKTVLENTSDDFVDEIDCRIKHKGGEYRLFNWKITRFDSEKLYITARDITPPKTVANKAIFRQVLASKNKPLIQIGERRGNRQENYIAEIAEGRSYTAAVADFAASLIRNINVLEKQDIESQLRIIYKVARTASLQSEDYAFINRYTDGNYTPTPMLLSLEKETKSALEDLAGMYEQKDMKISVKGGSEVKIYADPSATKALLRSMISYMIRISDGRGEIVIKCSREDNTALVLINHKDIKSPSDKSSIISIEKCKEVATSMGGSISADFSAQNGSTIKVKLPAVM